MKHLYFILTLFVISVISFSCRDDESLIPNSEVYVKTYTHEYTELMVSNHAITYTYSQIYPSNYKLGYGGIAIFRDLDGKLGCCDLACPYDRSRTNPMVVSMPFAVCPMCKSKFDLSYGIGNRVEGPAMSGLRMYRNIRDNGDYIVVAE